MRPYRTKYYAESHKTVDECRQRTDDLTNLAGLRVDLSLLAALLPQLVQLEPLSRRDRITICRRKFLKTCRKNSKEAECEQTPADKYKPAHSNGVHRRTAVLVLDELAELRLRENPFSSVSSTR